MTGLKQRDKACPSGSRGGTWAEGRGLEGSRPGCREPGSTLETLTVPGRCHLRDSIVGLKAGQNNLQVSFHSRNSKKSGQRS